ncbi:hypothetical protein G3A44_01030 [Ideonella sp. TBM-1]|uniref:Uncharacterized protein n=2 Tax=Ideonella livida TaxID=2707176 RepID=A0A7C9PF07_9BURK|nr:hypothetical protein [Ideonella livida]
MGLLAEADGVARRLAAAPAAPAQAQAERLDLDHLISECVPGGSICDPQHVADAIRAYFDSRRAAPAA